MITPQHILWGILYPGILAAVALVIGRFTQKSKREASPWAIGLAIAGGYLLAFIGISGGLRLPPTDAQGWLAIMGTLALVIPIAAMMSRKRLPPALLTIAFIIATTWMVTMRRQHALTSGEFYKLLATAIVAAVGWWALMEPLASRRRGPTIPILLSGVFGSAALVLINAGTQRMGQIEGAVAVVLLVIALLGFWLTDLTLSRGALAILTIVGLGTLYCGYLYADVKPIDIAILSVAALSAWIGEAPIIRTRRPPVRFAITAILVLGLTAIAVVPALSGLRKTMQEQSESSMYSM